MFSTDGLRAAPRLLADSDSRRSTAGAASDREAGMAQESFDIPPVIWWNNLERALLAVDDLGCRDLLY
jgi:hypothetical protein